MKPVGLVNTRISTGYGQIYPRTLIQAQKEREVRLGVHNTKALP